MELPKTFDPKTAEKHWYDLWVERGYFQADPARPGKVFSIVIPPPNVTGQLHLGHALNHTLHDVIVRMRRMQGYNTLWLPGTDHAGISTQVVVERELLKEKKDRHTMGRPAFEERVWAWKEQYGGRILQQMRLLGESVDWSRERFTLDPGLSAAVKEVFVRLYQQGLIYRALMLVNWCPRCETTLSDLEVVHKESDGQLWYIRYPFADGNGSITVATTRPETMLGDTAVAVNPDDPRYQAVLGRKIRLPLTGREIPLIADAAVDSQFGTGAVKITPAHDFNDFEIGKRHQLPEISVMDQAARMNANAGAYQGLTREDCRKRVVEDLEGQGLLEKIEPHRHSLAICDRCESTLSRIMPVEPMLSRQWFVKVKPMAEKAIAAVREGRTRFFPRQWENTYFNWMENIHDWAISRQLWWGHRIPAYECQRCQHLMVAGERPDKCAECGGTDLKQEEDVLDTWFSSGLWPFSTLGWPANTAELQRYYPNSLLITAYDIIFFWVARMMMFGLHFTGEVPFRDIYITPMVRDAHGRKMTKSRGNVVDPLEIMDKYGTDAVRFTFAQLSVQGRDLALSDERLTASRAFANKIWNAARFVLMNLEDAPQPLEPAAAASLELADRWILSRLHATIDGLTRMVDAYEFNDAALLLYQFIWHDFCDWYIELAKEPLRSGGARRRSTQYVLTHCFDWLLRMLHPFMPFISEELWQAIRPYVSEPGLAPHLAVAKFPEAGQPELLSPDERAAMLECVEFTQAVNSLRSFLGYHPGQKVFAMINPANNPVEADHGSNAQGIKQRFEIWKGYAMTMAKIERLEVLDAHQTTPERMVTSVLNWTRALAQAPEGFDFAKARAALQKQLDESRKHRDAHWKRFNDAGFQAKADEDTKLETREKAEQLDQRIAQLETQITLLEQHS